MKKIIIKFFDNNPAAIYYLSLLIVLFGALFGAALVGYFMSIMAS